MNKSSNPDLWREAERIDAICPRYERINEVYKILKQLAGREKPAIAAPFQCSICNEARPHSHHAIYNRSNDPAGNNQTQKMVGWSEPKYFGAVEQAATAPCTCGASSIYPKASCPVHGATAAVKGREGA